jgi:hypothetical protein
MKTFKNITVKKIETIICDGCGLQANAESGYEFHEFISIEHHCGYSSIHGDGKYISIDLCQQCFADMCGNSLRVVDKNKIENFDGNCETDQLEYNNIFDVITKSKTGASQLKNDCDIRLAARDILTKNKVNNDKELAISLKRVEQLWDAQYQSAEGNELHQLADLICAYEKKDWNSYFEEAPFADDDFMPSRLNLKSKYDCDEEQTASGMLSSISVSTEINDESSRDSALVESNLDDTKQHLLKSITNVIAKYPELRLGQLLVNAINIQQPCPEIFHVEDNVLAEKLNELANSVNG